MQAMRVTGEGTVGETTAPSPSSAVDLIRGDTLRDHDSSDERCRGRAGDTATPPTGIVMSEEVRSNGVAGETAISPIAMLSDVVRTNSPTTSTPGSTPSPNGRREDMFMESELQEGEMSAINSSGRKEDIDEDEDDEIAMVRETRGEEITLDGKSVKERIQAASDSAWNMILEKEEKEGEPRSCVAQRTRSHTGDTRRKKTSLFMGEEDSTMGSFLDATGDPIDSLTLFKATQEDRNWENKEKWRTGITELNTTVDQATEMIERGNSNIDVVREIKRRRCNEHRWRTRDSGPGERGRGDAR